jgi:hypothetical protein
MTPARLNELTCPSCGHANWIIDSDYRGTDGTKLPYNQREYACRQCSNKGVGWTLIQQSPPEFFLQPHDLYPMTQKEFDRWAAILKAHFPDHPRLADLGKTFFPRTP